MIKNITRFMKKRDIGVDLSDGKLKVFEIKDNIYINKSIEEISPNINSNNYSYSSNFINQSIKYVLDNTNKSLLRPRLYISIPYEVYQLNRSEFINDVIFKSRVDEIYMVNNFICAAIGSGIAIREVEKRIFIYCLSNLTYIGLLFGGHIFNGKILEKGYNGLIEIDIKDSIESILKEISPELPKNFTKMDLPIRLLQEATIGWRLDIERKVYLSIPSNLKNKFGSNIGKYQLVYLEYENSTLKGLEKIMENAKKHGVSSHK